MKVLRTLKEQSRILERHVRHYSYATEDEVNDYRPGGEENPHRNVWGWIRFYANLVRFCGREERQVQDPDDIDRVILQAMRREPETVTLEDGASLDVHPKGMAALLDLDFRERSLAWIGLRYAILLDKLTNGQGDPDTLELAERVKVEITRQQAVIAWIVCSPDPQPPFDCFTNKTPDIPDEWLHLSVVDLVRVNTAFHVVNSGRMQALDAFLTKKRKSGDEERPTWSQFVGNLSKTFKVPPRDLMYDFSLPELLATVATTAPPERDKKTAA